MEFVVKNYKKALNLIHTKFSPSVVIFIFHVPRREKQVRN